MENILRQGEKAYEYKNYRNIPEDTRFPSKSRLKKCKKGLHEFIKKPFTNIDKNTISTEQWACKHCGLYMDSR